MNINMKRKKLFTAICLTTGLLLAGCTKDDVTDENALPEGQYPLEIASVTMNVESSEQPWTRVVENADGMSSAWEWDGNEKISVQLYADGETATYTLKDHLLTSDQTLYWRNTQQATVKAWYPAYEGESGTVSLADQTNGLTYVLTGTGTGDYNAAVSLSFSHALAKVRVALNGTQSRDVQTVEVKSYTTCTHTKGTISTNSTSEGWITMHKVDGTNYYEANVVPSDIMPSNFIRLNESIVVENLENIPTTLGKGVMYSINLTVGKPIIDITADNCSDINGNGNYRVSGEFKHNITITGGSPTLYLENANISVGSGNAISITGGTPTIHVNGNNTGTSGDGAGIYVASGYTVTITGSSREDKLTVSGGNSGCGIGGYLISQGDGVACGDITIRNVTVTSYGSWTGLGDMAAGIGSTSGASCGAIIIENATVHAYGKGLSSYATPAIGCGITAVGSPKSIPVVKISDNSEIHAHRGGSVDKTDYIGWASIVIYANNAINLGGGTCTSSTVYCYTGESETPDKTVEYDENGEEKEL